MLKTLLVRYAALALLSIFTATVYAGPIFEGQFDVSNFVLNQNGGNGSVDVGNAPNGITLYGSDGGPMVPINTTYLVTVVSPATVSFDWVFFSEDIPTADWFGYYLNGVSTPLGYTSGDSGSMTVNLNAGDIFGFYVQSADNTFGRGWVEIFGTQTNPAAVPEPASAALFAVGGGFLLLLRRKRRSGRN